MKIDKDEAYDKANEISLNEYDWYDETTDVKVH